MGEQPAPPPSSSPDEINAEPVPLGGRPFSAVAAGFESALREVRRAAAACGAGVVVSERMSRPEAGA